MAMKQGCPRDALQLGIRRGAHGGTPTYHCLPFAFAFSTTLTVPPGWDGEPVCAAVCAPWTALASGLFGRSFAAVLTGWLWLSLRLLLSFAWAFSGCVLTAIHPFLVRFAWSSCLRS